MSATTHEHGADLVGGLSAPRRPPVALSLLLDAGFATAAYLPAYLAAVPGHPTDALHRGRVVDAAGDPDLPADRPLPSRAPMPPAEVRLARTRDWRRDRRHGRGERRDGRDARISGLSRSAFVADAMLLVIATVGWRGAWVLRARARSAEAGRDTELVDRAAEVTPLVAGALQPLSLPGTR